MAKISALEDHARIMVDNRAIVIEVADSFGWDRPASVKVEPEAIEPLAVKHIAHWGIKGERQWQTQKKRT